MPKIIQPALLNAAFFIGNDNLNPNKAYCFARRFEINVLEISKQQSKHSINPAPTHNQQIYFLFFIIPFNWPRQQHVTSK